MGQRIRTHNWSLTTLGPVDTWPQSLKTALRIMLDSRYPMFVWWGQERINFYNDAYIPVLGKRHPQALGQRAMGIWGEIWPVIGPQSDIVLNEGRATWNEDTLLLMERNHFLEETYFTFSYSPLPNDEGGIGGVFCACTEETQRVLSQRRLRTLRDVADQPAQAKTAEHACKLAVATLAENPYDLPFVALYLLQGAQANLSGAAGLNANSPACPRQIHLNDALPTWPFAEVYQTGKAAIVPHLPERFGSLPGGAWPESPLQAIVLPLAKPGQLQPTGFLVAGLSPRLAVDEHYLAFLDLLGRHVATAVANARAYEEERRRAEALAELDRAKTTFFSNITHEFRTPLALMLGPMEAILDQSPELPQAAREQLDMVHRNSLRLLKLVNTMLDFSQIEAGRIRASYEPVDLARYTAELTSVFRTAIEQAGLRLVVSCPPLSEPVYVDRDMWEKIVLNLLSNAFKFTLAGEIEVSLTAENNHALLTVCDTGVGIPTAEIPKIFDRFHRVRESRGRSYEGTGIGLALVQELVRHHGGTVRAASVVNEGTEFVVSIPFGTEHLDPQRVAPETAMQRSTTGAEAFVQEALRWLPEGALEEAAERPFHLDPIALLEPIPQWDNRTDEADRPRIVWADDNADLREYVTRLLADHFEVTAVANGQTALSLIRANPPDLVLTDVMMPGLDGVELLKAIRTDPRLQDLPVMLLSARAGEEARIEGLEAGADDYLIKPFSWRELLARVEGHIRLSRMRHKNRAALRASEARFRTMADSAPVLIWISGPEKQFTWFNEKWLAFVGRTMAEVLGSGWTENIHPDDFAHCLKTYNRSFENREPFSIEARLQRHDGVYRWMLNNGIPLYDPDGRFTGYIGSCIDIHDSKQAEQALREKEERYRALVEGQSEMVCRFRPDGTILFVNNAYARARGTTPEALMGINFWEFVNEEDRPGVREMLAQLQPDAPEVRIENRFETTEGTRWTLWTNRGLTFDENGRVTEVQSSGMDITARRRAEEAVRTNEQRLRLALKGANAGAWSLNVATKQTHWSVEYYSLYGYDKTTPANHNLWIARVHPDDLAGIEADFAAQLASDTTEYSQEYRIVHPERGIRWILDMGHIHRDDEGTAVRVDGINIDITNRKEAEDAVRQSEERFRHIFNTAGVAVRVEDFSEVKAAIHQLQAEGVTDFRAYLAAHPEFAPWAVQSVKVLDVNQETLHMFGAATKAQLLGSLANIFAPESHDVFIEELVALAEGHNSLRTETTLHALDGRPIAVLFTIHFSPQGSESGRVVVTLTDITHQKQAEQTLRQSEQRFKSMADTAPAMLWITDENHLCTFLSRGWYDYTGQTEAEGLRLGWTNAVHPEDRGKTAQIFLEAAAENRPFRMDYRLHRSDGLYHWVTDSGRPRFSSSGKLLGYIGSVMDIHERKQAEEELRQLNEKLEQRVAKRTVELERQNQRLRQLANQLSEAEQQERRRLARTLHDGLQQILIAGKIQLSTFSEDDMAETIARLEEIFNEAIYVSRSLSYDLSPPVLYSSDLRQAIHWLARWFLTNHRFEVQVTAEQEVPLVPDHIKNFLFDAVRELLLNAVKHSGVKAASVVLHQDEPGQICLTVTDDGHGFNPDNLDQGEQEVFGFGLFRIRERLIALGGSLTITAKPGDGASFTMVLPVTETANSPHPYDPAPLPELPIMTADPPDRSGQPIRVLVVDDHSIVRKGLISMLDREADIEVVGEASDGVEAVERVHELQPSIVVMDIDMPRMNGVEATRRIKQQFPETLIIGLSVYEEQHKMEEMRRAGASTYLRKGGDAETFLKTIRSVG